MMTTASLEIIEERIEHERPDLPVCNECEYGEIKSCGASK